MRVLGIDPGLSGALAEYDSTLKSVYTRSMPTLSAGTGSKRILDEVALARMIEEMHQEIDHVFLEKVSAMPGQGVTSMFTFGQVYGVIKGIIASYRLPVTLIHPTVWKKSLTLSKSKDASRLRATELFPSYSEQWKLKKHDGRAEAALIAYYGVNK